MAAWLTRAFLGLCALWVVAQGHFGSFLGRWGDESSLPGNICWLLILYCLARLAIHWGAASLQRRRLSDGALFFVGSLLVAELGWQVMDRQGEELMLLGIVTFFLQPLLVLLGLAVLHRRTQASRHIAQ